MTPRRLGLPIVLALAAAAGAARGDALESVVRTRVAAALPDDLGVADVQVTRGLAGLDVEPATVAVELPRAVSVGRASVKLTIGRRPPVFVPVTVAKLVTVAIANRALAPGAVVEDGDVALERRPALAANRAPLTLVGSTVRHAIAPGGMVTVNDVEQARPLPRGSQLTVELRRGNVRLRGTGTLEAAARPGEPATARMIQTRTVVRGRLSGRGRLVVEVDQ